MHKIEQAIYLFLEKACHGAVDINEEFVEEFGERCKSALRRQFNKEQEPFRLRMSNIGKPIRELWLDKTYGRVSLDPYTKVKMIYGDIIENLGVFLLRASGCAIDSIDKKVELNVVGEVISGELDIVVGGKYYDIKSASKYSYNSKFTDFQRLCENDDFGYIAQNEGYARADNIPNGGWLVFNKETGEFKIVEAPNRYEPAYEQIKQTVTFFKKDNKPPNCPGVEEESFYKKKTGRIIIGSKCLYCDHKQKCHPEAIYRPSMVSQAKNTPYVWYLKLNEGEE